MDLDHVEFIWASDMVKNPDYWKLVLQVGKSNALGRFVRTAEMMGREASMEGLTGANVIYSCMQVADIFMLGARVTQLGMDQRKVNMLAREVGPLLGFWKPVVVSHHMLMGLQKIDVRNTIKIGADIDQRHHSMHLDYLSNPPKRVDTMARVIALKMSKSNPDSAIFMTDSKEDVERKINRAYCPEGEIKENPILEYCRYILFETADSLLIERPEKFGGSITLYSYQELEQQFGGKQIHPQDLKQAVTRELNLLLDPIRKHFEENAEARALLEQVKSFQVTR
jgi:tyrosyl-tRNA synthetase